MTVTEGLLAVNSTVSWFL